MGDDGFKVGDVVRLKSGSELMTVAERAAGNTYKCVWMTKDADIRFATFPSLVLVDRSQEALR